MSTAMVITTVITTDVDVEKVKTFTLEQIRDNDQSLLNNLLDRGVDAHVTTAILNIEEFLDYMRVRQRKLARRKAKQPTALPTPPAAATVVVTDEMSELEFMEYTLQQLQTGERQPTVALSPGVVEAMEEEHIGEYFSRHPFLY